VAIAQDVFARLERQGNFGRTLTLKVKFNDFTQITRSRTVTFLLNSLPSLQNWPVTSRPKWTGPNPSACLACRSPASTTRSPPAASLLYHFERRLG
jgi:nucleotidyltransferase/DNA polymerase involved in DNA repair